MFRFRWFSPLARYYLSFGWKLWNLTVAKWYCHDASMRSYQCPPVLYMIVTHQSNVFCLPVFRRANTIRNYLQTHQNGTHRIHGSGFTNEKNKFQYYFICRLNLLIHLNSLLLLLCPSWWHLDTHNHSRIHCRK